MSMSRQIIIQFNFALTADKYNELSKQREDLWKKCQRTDSKKKEAELIEQVRKFDNQINGFYLLDEWKEDVYV